MSLKAALGTACNGRVRDHAVGKAEREAEARPIDHPEVILVRAVHQAAFCRLELDPFRLRTY
jgi:hypothetical protein